MQLIGLYVYVVFLLTLVIYTRIWTKITTEPSRYKIVSQRAQLSFHCVFNVVNDVWRLWILNVELWTSNFSYKFLAFSTSKFHRISTSTKCYNISPLRRKVIGLQFVKNLRRNLFGISASEKKRPICKKCLTSNFDLELKSKFDVFYWTFIKRRKIYVPAGVTPTYKCKWS